MDLPEHYVYVRKTSPSAEIAATIRSLLVAAGVALDRRVPSLRDRISDALEAKPGLGGLGIDLKRVFRLGPGRKSKEE